MQALSKMVAANDTEQQATLFVALELSQATWVVALHSPVGADGTRGIGTDARASPISVT